MKSRATMAGWIPLLAVSLTVAACSHNRSEEKEGGQQQQQAGQSSQAQQQQSAQGGAAMQGQGQGQTQTQGTMQEPKMLGEQNVTPGTAQIQRQKKVISTVIVKDKIPTVKETTIRADINRMDAKQFTAIGFPSEVSQGIVQYRDRNGPFRSVHELKHVEGVSQSLLDKFDGALGVEQSAAGISGQSQNQGQSQGFGQQSDSSQSLSGD